MPTAKEALQKECIKLRLEERLSISEIQERTGASRGSVSVWVRKYPLTPEEIRGRASMPPVIKKARGETSVLFGVVSDHTHSSSSLGKVGEAAVLLRLVSRAWEVYSSPFDGDKADWIVDVNGRLFKLQVRLARQLKVGLPIVSLMCNHRQSRLQKGSFDFVVGFDVVTDTAYVWSWEETEHLKSSITITPHAAERWDKLEVSGQISVARI